MRDKTVVITGASSGIGREAALAFARRGSNVVLAARRAELLNEVRAEVEKLGVKALVVPTDVTVPAQAQRLVDASIEHFGRIDVLVNNAGIGLMGAFIEAPTEETRRLFEVNFFGAVYVMRAVLSAMERQGWGTIINVASVAGLLPSPYIPIYNASKAALVMLSESVNAEYLGSRIKIVAFCPAMTRTEFGAVMKRVGRFKRWHRPGGAVSSKFVAAEMVQAVLHPRPLITLGPLPFIGRLIKLLIPGMYYRIVRWYRDRMREVNQPGSE